MSNTFITIENGSGKKVLAFILAGFVCLAGSAAVLYAHADLSGEWKLNEQKSEFGQFGSRMAPKQLKVVSGADSMSVERKSVTQNGEERTTLEKLSFDGKETENIVFGNSKKKSTAKWSEDGQTLSVNSTLVLSRNGEPMEIKVTEKWMLTEKGNVLSVESVSTSSWGTNTMKLVYERVR